MLGRLKKDARSLGFRPISPSRCARMVVEYPADGCGSAADLDRRHALEDAFDELTGWLGLGHCDGGSIGSGAMEVFLIVVDFERAKQAIEREVAGTALAGFSRIYRVN